MYRRRTYRSFRIMPHRRMRYRPGWLFQIVLVLTLTGYVPGEARGPLHRERTMAGVRIYFAPRDNLAEVDMALIAGARRRIDMAAYVLTDRGIMRALMDAARRGVRIRLYLDPNQPAARNSDSGSVFWTLLRTPNIEVRSKRGNRNLMHLKAYHVDGRLLRTGAGNFSWSGARRQDNDLLVLESPHLAARFIERFEFMWTRPDSGPFPGARDMR